ncbi:hypothetical protein B0H12DRAFT_1246828 [Mycena haematopus]|nr:hypothetical protein B0H12DRAFT_1246828 [Mycena haematopus]
MSGRRPHILRSPSYWADFHRRRRERAERDARALASTPGDFVLLGCQEHGAVYTFTPGRALPYISVVQNDGRLLTLPPSPEEDPPPPSRTRPPAAPPPLPSVTPKDSKLLAATARARARQAAQPDPDEVLLRRLQASGTRPSLKRKAVFAASDAEGSKRCGPND